MAKADDAIRNRVIALLAAVGALGILAVGKRTITTDGSGPSGNNGPSSPAGASGASGSGAQKPSRVAELARNELGGRDLNRYFASAAPSLVGARVEWCGIFALYILREAGLTDWQWQIGRGFLYRLKQTTTPQVGDMAYFDKAQHHAIVVDVNQNAGTVDLVNGNGQGGVVSASTTAIGNVRAFYSIQQLLE